MKKKAPAIGDRICELIIAYGEYDVNRRLKMGWKLWGTGIPMEDCTDGIAFTMVKLAPLPEEDEE